MLRHDLKKAVCNPYFIVCVIVATVLLIQKTMENWGGSQDMNGLLGSLLYTCELGYITLVIPILSSLPFAGSYYEEVHSGYQYATLIRGSKKGYMFGKALAAFISGFLVIFLACIFFEMVIFWQGDFQIAYGGMWLLGNFDFYVGLASNHMEFVAVIAKIVLLSGYGGMWSLICLVVSSFIDNRYITVVAPFFIERFLMYLFSFLEIDGWHPYSVSLPIRADILDRMCGGLLYGFVYLFVVCVVLTIIFGKRLMQRLK